MSQLIVSGAQPSGILHIGNYFGAIKQMVNLQSQGECRFFLADMHAQTTISSAEQLQSNIIDLARAYLAVGLDPEKTIIFKQSDVPEVTELAWTLSCLASMPYLMRAHSFKDAQAKDKEVSVGLFNYPILMAADILIHNATLVPVGKDQKQHLEIARDMARKFNSTYGHTFVEPEAYIIESVEIVPGTDGEKMSKSKSNTIPLFATHDEIKKAIMSIPTDSASVADSKNPDTNTIYRIHKLFLTPEQDEVVRAKYVDGGMGYKEAKDMCIESVEHFIAPLRTKFNSISDEDVKKVLAQGKERVRPHVIKQMEIIRAAIGTTL